MKQKRKSGVLVLSLMNLDANELIIRGIPADLPEESEQDLFEELVEQLKQSYSDLKLNKPESLITRAGHAGFRCVMR